MKIIIVGCGKVGFTLVEQLNNEGHDITALPFVANVLGNDKLKRFIKE